MIFIKVNYKKKKYIYLHKLYSSPSIIRIIKSRRRIGMHIGNWWACQKERDH
jgi:hypothetical protein